MTRVPGIVGGTGPESTIDYYRSLIARYRTCTRSQNNPHLIVYSIDVRRLLDDVARGDLDGLTEYLAGAVESLARAGANFALLAANTPHVVYQQLAARAPIPMLSIVDVTLAAAKERALNRLAIFGTRFTMEARFYPEVFEPGGIALVAPDEGERAWIHHIYMNELIPGLFLPETRARLLAIVDKLREREGIDGVILAGTELPLILRQESHNGVVFLDTTAIHVDATIAWMLAPDR